ncbi:metallophosphoesterase family protein [Tardisphaera miroshnichenkoae]
MEGRRIDYVAFLGDLVGYYPWPNEVCDIGSSLFDYAIMGNHDYSIINEDFAGYNDLAVIADSMNARSMSSSCINYLKSLKPKINLDVGPLHILMVHGSPSDPLFEYVYPEDAHMLDSNYDVIALGHTHIQYEKKLTRTTVINPGSVGQPRDGDPRAAYCVVKIDDKASVEMIRVKYDVAGAARLVLEAGYPKFLAQRLIMGI